VTARRLLLALRLRGGGGPLALLTSKSRLTSSLVRLGLLDLHVFGLLPEAG
jgi:hypothetical protein